MVRRICNEINLGLMFAVLLTAVPSVGMCQALEPFSLTISNDMGSVKAGKNVFIRIAEQNLTDNVLNCSSWVTSSTDMSYRYTVKDSDGHTLTARRGADKMDGSYRACELEANRSMSGEYLISWLYDLSKPGTYTVQVTRAVSNDESSPVVTSNIITIIITK
jgi:hypothetical protein